MDLGHTKPFVVFGHRFTAILVFCMLVLHSTKAVITDKEVSGRSSIEIFNVQIQYFLVGFEVLMAASMKMAVYFVVTPCSLVEV
jgi:hypothetical protein